MILIASLFTLVELSEKYLLLSKNEKDFEDNLITSGNIFFF